jgi:hypothetical protein
MTKCDLFFGMLGNSDNRSVLKRDNYVIDKA